MDFQLPKPFEWNYCGTCGAKLIIEHDGQSERPYCRECMRHYYRNPVPAACCFVRRGADELLFVQRAVHPCKGQWSLPGGFIELDETTEEAALRELREETGLRAGAARLFGASTKQSPISGAVMVLGYVVDEWEGEDEMRAETDAMAVQFFAKADRPPLAFNVHRELLELYDCLDAVARG